MYSPGGDADALSSAQKGFIPSTPSSHCLGLGLPGDPSVCSPNFRASASACRSRKPPSPPVFLRIYPAHFTVTPILFPTQACYFPQSPGPAGGFHTGLDGGLRALHARYSEQRLPPPHMRLLGHRVSRGFLHRYTHTSDVLGRVDSSQSTGVCSAFILHAASLVQGFPIDKNSPLLPP